MANQVIDLSVGVKPAVQLGPTAIEYTVYPDGSISVDTVKTPAAERGKGWGRKAMDAFIAATAGRALFLTAEPIRNEVSLVMLLKFYRSLGFAPVTWEVKRRYPAFDYYRMVRLPQP